MSKIYFTIILAIMLIIVLSTEGNRNNEIEDLKAELECKKGEIGVLINQVENQKEKLKCNESTINTYEAIIDHQQLLLMELSDKMIIAEPKQMHLTVYDLSYESCEKYPDDPAYGITASGKKVVDGYTVAMGRLYPFGTKVYIPDMRHLNGTGIFECMDRGGAIDNGDIDIFVGNEQLSMDWSKDTIVYILQEDL